ncbi:hypothetical protein [Acinetobacter sp. P1(2025)]|uniref:hypothetical protein n=1 Tax=Acinetobacter sp. P1(2025) TaxID=3446120 RepID=UPI003F531B27
MKFDFVDQKVIVKFNDGSVFIECSERLFGLDIVSAVMIFGACIGSVFATTIVLIRFLLKLNGHKLSILSFMPDSDLKLYSMFILGFMCLFSIFGFYIYRCFRQEIKNKS